MIALEQLLANTFGISCEDLTKATTFQQRHGGRLEHILVNMGALADERLPELYQLFLQLPAFDTAQISQCEPLSQWGGASVNEWRQWHWLPVSYQDQVWLLVRDPLDPEANQQLHLACSEGEPMPKLTAVAEADLLKLSQQLETEPSTLLDDDLSSVEEDKLRELASEAPVVNLLNTLIAKGLKIGASDMHLEPHDGLYRARMRVDGVLHEVERISSRMSLPLVSRLKILAGMDIAEKRRPQDGKIAMKIANEELDIRVSALPLNEGESLVLRFLRQQAIRYDMATLGLAIDIEQQILQDIQKTSGVILLTGPTGSGKTTSLYTFLSQLNCDDSKIITLEDPVEYQLAGVNQVQVQSEIGFGFAEGLRSIVRQDPDVIMLGEIRDAETARIAMQSALTGHLVFSTVHTNDAPSAYTRLIDLGAEEYLLNAAIVAIIAQRLARKLCTHCATSHPDPKSVDDRYGVYEIAQRFGVQPALKQAVGCEHCGHTGYKGRMALIEYLPVDDTIRGLPKDERFIQQAADYRRQQGGRDLLADGLLKVARGLTTIEEVMRVAG